MKNNTNKLFNLQGLLLSRIDFNDEEKQILVNARGPAKFVRCPKCSKGTKKIHQVNHRIIKHGMLDYRVVVLRLRVRRLKCRNCKIVFTESFPGIDRRRTTPNFRLQLLDWLKEIVFDTLDRSLISPRLL